MLHDLRAEENYAVRLACENGHLDIVQFLCNDDENSSKLDAKDLCSRNNDAVTMAWRNGHFGIVKYLYKLGWLKRAEISVCPGCISKLDSN
jgi:hypothetical protein